MAIVQSIVIGSLTLDIDESAADLIAQIEALKPDLLDNIEFSRLLANNQDSDGRVVITMDGGGSRVVFPSNNRADKSALNLNPNSWGTDTSYIGFDGDRHEFSFARVFIHELIHVVGDTDDLRLIPGNFEQDIAGVLQDAEGDNIGETVEIANSILSSSAFGSEPARAHMINTVDPDFLTGLGVKLSPNERALLDIESYIKDGDTVNRIQLSSLTADTTDSIEINSGGLNSSARPVDDLIISFDSSDKIDSGDGDDYIYSSGGNDIITSGEGNDVIRIFSGMVTSS